MHPSSCRKAQIGCASLGRFCVTDSRASLPVFPLLSLPNSTSLPWVRDSWSLGRESSLCILYQLPSSPPSFSPTPTPQHQRAWPGPGVPRPRPPRHLCRLPPRRRRLQLLPQTSAAAHALPLLQCRRHAAGVHSGEISAFEGALVKL